MVTHRLGAAKLAHRVVVVDAGEIVDTGTHEELLSRPGKYADMWAAQRSGMKGLMWQLMLALVYKVLVQSHL